MKTWLWIALALLLLWLLLRGDMTEWTVEKIAQAFAYAEGFYVRNSRPARNHNPGDLTIDVIGQGVGRDGIYVIYPDDATGWAALRQQVHLMFSGSRIYRPDMTIAEIASLYTTTEQSSWAKNVAQKLNVSVDTKLIDIRA